MSKRWRRVLARNDELEREANPARATREQFRLLKRYLDRRHPGGGMTDMEIRDYAGMVDASPVHTAVFEYRNRLNNKPGDDGALQAAALTDVLRDGLSMVYSFYRPELTERSVGSFMVLQGMTTFGTLVALIQLNNGLEYFVNTISGTISRITKARNRNAKPFVIWSASSWLRA